MARRGIKEETVVVKKTQEEDLRDAQREDGEQRKCVQLQPWRLIDLFMHFSTSHSRHRGLRQAFDRPSNGLWRGWLCRDASPLQAIV